MEKIHLIRRQKMEKTKKSKKQRKTDVNFNLEKSGEPTY